MTTKIPVELSSTPGIVDGSNATAITIDSSEQVGIGTTSPSNLLHISSSTGDSVEMKITNTNADSIGANIHLEKDSASPADNDFCGEITWVGSNDNNQQPSFGSISVQMTDVSDGTEDGDMIFKTSGGGTFAERMGIRSNGYVDFTGAADLRVTFGSTGTAGNNDANWVRGEGSSLSFNAASTSHKWEIGGTQRMVLLSSGNLGIGSSAPHEMLHVEGTSGTEVLVAARTDDAGALASYYLKADSTGTDVRKKAAFIFRRDDPGTRGTGTLHICLDGANDEGSAAVVDSKMQFSADGEISITKGRTNFSAEESAFSPGSHNGHMIDINGQSASGRAATNTQTHRSFLNPNGTVGSISTNGSATAYNTSSDYRLKENVVTDWNGTTLLKQLKPSKFNFKADADTTVQGFLAHEVSSIVPEAVTGEKDAVYTAEEAIKGLAVEGQPKYQGIDQAKLVPLLVKTIQELEARITTLEGE